MIKKSNRFIALMLVVFICNVYSMKRAHEAEKVIPAGSRILLPTGRWVEIVGDVLLDEAHIKDLVHFTDLPAEILGHIIYLLRENKHARSLEKAAKDINSLALVNKELNALINNPSFCLHLIKHLSQKFDYTNYEVVQVLQTKEAQRRFKLQKELYDECVIEEELSIEILEELLKEGVDLNFTYTTMVPFGDLLMEVYTHSNDPSLVIQWLVDHGANKDQQNHLLLYIIEYLSGDHNNFFEHAIEIVQILLNAKADPEMSDENGHSILSLMQKALEQRQKQYDAIIGGEGENQYRRSVISEDIDTFKTAVKLLEVAIQRKRKLLGH